MEDRKSLAIVYQWPLNQPDYSAYWLEGLVSPHLIPENWN